VTPREAAQIFGDLYDRVQAELTELDADDWSRRTPCPNWDVRALASHLAGAQTFFDASAPQPSTPEGWAPPEGASPLDAWAEAGVAARRNWTPAQVLEELAVARDGAVARLEQVTDWDAPHAGPTGETTEAGFLAVRCFDAWVHLQDLRIALGRDAQTADSLPALGLACRFVWERLPVTHAKRVAPPDDSALRVLVREPHPAAGVLRRDDGRVTWADGDAADWVEADPGALLLLVAGRGDAEHWQARGALDWSGPLGAAFVARARFF
jgi:uncharacterized protein (TIGR03083 family)